MKKLTMSELRVLEEVEDLESRLKALKSKKAFILSQIGEGFYCKAGREISIKRVEKKVVSWKSALESIASTARIEKIRGNFEKSSEYFTCKINDFRGEYEEKLKKSLLGVDNNLK